MIPLLIVVIALAIVEAVLAWKWNRWYCTTGLPIFLKRVESPVVLANVPTETLERASKTAAGAAFSFRRLDDDVIVFRESAMQYVPLMRGVITRDRGEAQVVVRGLVNWFFVVFLAGLPIVLGRLMLSVVVYPALAVGVIYLIQGVRFARVARAIQEPRKAA